MVLKKLPKNKEDVKFINPDTMQVECTYNQCFTKFTESEEFVFKTPGWNEYRPIKHKNFFHKCSECSRKYQNSNDKGKSIQNYESSLFEPTLTSDETKKVLKQLKKIYESTHDVGKKKTIAKVFNTYKGKLNG